MEQSDENRVADFEYLVQFHLRAELVVGGIPFAFVFPAEDFDFEILRARLEKAYVHDFGIIDGNDARAFLRARLRVAFRMQVEERQPPAGQQEDHDGNQIRFLFFYIL